MSKILTIEQFEEQFIPQKNHFVEDAPYNDWAYETYGQEYEYVLSIHNTEPNRVWTIVDVDGCSIFVPGMAFVNRMSYIITQVPWIENQISEVSDPEEVELYLHHYRAKNNKTGKYVATGYNEQGIESLATEFKDEDIPGFEDVDELSAYEMEEFFKKSDYSVEHSEDPFPDLELIEP